MKRKLMHVLGFVSQEKHKNLRINCISGPLPVSSILSILSICYNLSSGLLLFKQSVFSTYALPWVFDFIFNLFMTFLATKAYATNKQIEK